MIWQIIWYVLIGTWWAVGGYLFFYFTQKQKVKIFREKIANINKLSEDIIRKAEQKWREIIENAQKDIQRKTQKLDIIEDKLLQKEEKLDKKAEQIEKQLEQKIIVLEQEKKDYQEKKEQLEQIITKQKTELTRIAKLSEQEAKNELLNIVENEHKKEIVMLIQKYKAIKTEEADKEWSQIIAKILPRVAMNSVSEFTVSSVDLPSEDVKGKLIGREGRNVSYFEKLTGVEVLIDDTPLIVKLSSYDNDKRFMAVETLQRLIKDGRINPVYIEKTYNEVINSFDQLLIEKGKEALAILNIPMLKPDIVRMIGQFHLRYSYGQNLWIHSIEVAKIAEALAHEMGFDALQAKKAWLLHDIGKVIASTWQSHTKIGADVLRKYGFDDIIVNAAEAHHHDVPITHPIGWIVTAADGISASRPWARFNTKALFIEKMSELEKLISSVEWVEKVHIMQAGREIMIFVNPQLVDDLGVEKLIKKIGEKVEEQLDYPGMIRVVAIRETKVIDYLR